MWPPDWGGEYNDAKETIPWPESDTGYIRVRRGDFGKYITDDLAAAVRTWRKIKRYGWPQGKGYLSEPAAVVEIVELFDAESENFRMFREKERSNG